jgi:hypothetical protein
MQPVQTLEIKDFNCFYCLNTSAIDLFKKKSTFDTIKNIKTAA